MAERVDQERIFLSAVSGEFRTAREGLARTLRGAGLGVREQDSFRNEPGSLTLLGKLHDYIKDCSVVVSLIGTRGGTRPQPDEAADFRNKLPDWIDGNSFPDWSYTQWEVFFAIHYDRPLVVVVASNTYVPDEPGAADARQSRFVALLKARGIDLTTEAGNADRLELEALRSLYRRGLAHRPDNVPFQSLGDLFTGREDFLARVRASLTRENGGASAIIAVQGMGGIGKTRAAVEYALRHRDAYTALLFVRANDEQTLTSELAALTGVLRLPEDSATETAVRKAAVLRWLADHTGWLLILDNIDTPDAVRAADEIVRTLRGGHVLLTSRLDDAFRQEIEPLDLGLLSLDDAAAYLLKATSGRRRTEPGEAAQARVLAEALDRLTLALVHAGAYIAERRISFSRYLTEWTGNRVRVLDWARPEKTGYPMSLAQTWLTSMDQLSDSGRALLERLSFFANDPVPEFLLDVPLPGTETAEGMEPLLDLQRFSLIARDAEAERFTIHRIVRDVTNRRLATDPAAHKARLTEALRWLNAAFVGDCQDVRTWPRLDPLATHAETLAWAADEVGIAEPAGRLMNQLGVLFDVKAQHAHSEVLKRRVLAINQANFGPDHPTVAVCLNNLAHLLQATNRLAEAEPLMRRAFAIDEASLGPDHPNVARDLNNLALLLQETNRLPESEPLMRRALAIGEASLDPDNPAVATRLNNLAMLLMITNRPAEAEPLMRRAVTIDEASFGPDDPNVARDLNNLASLLKATNRLAEAEPLMRRALAIDEASFGPDHPAVGASLNNIARLLQDTNRAAAAEPLMRRALAIDEASFGPDHPNVATRLNNLARLLQDTDRPAEAEPLMRRMLVILLTFQRSTGHPHPRRDAAIDNYRHLLAALGRDEAAISAAIEDASREAGLG